jgi:hypothetical protein
MEEADMDVKQRLTLAALAAVAAMAAGALIGTGASAAPTSCCFDTTLFIRGPFRGVVEARHQGQSATVQVTVSLHRLKAGTSYQVAASSTRCGTALESSSILYVVSGRTSASGRDLFKQAKARTRGDLSTGKSVRIIEVSRGGDRVERSCGVAINLQEATQM